MYSVSGVFGLKNIDSLPTPVGIEIEDEKDGIVYLDSSLDKWSMRRDRKRIFQDLNIAINEAKHEQAGKAN
jgi:hypothetical protein